MKDAFKHAFAIEDSIEYEPNEKQKYIVDKVCREVVKRQLTLPAQAMLETFRPLNYIGSQIMHFFQPIISAVLTGDGYTEFSLFLEKRGSVDYLCRRINEIVAEGETPVKK